ncbi:MAG TPA: phage tail protein [Dissulfurispiraceae bacterium]|nr:phage tail protein [Dissulfurispiraceae bacterium]
MKEPEFKKQVFKTIDQWGCGLFKGLELLEGGGCTLPYIPAVSTVVAAPSGIVSPLVIAADCCGTLYIFSSGNHMVYRYDPATGVAERIFCPDIPDLPGRMLISKTRLWTVDTAGRKVRVCSLNNLQTIFGIDLLEQPIDIALNADEDIYVLDGKTKLIHRFDRNGTLIACFGAQYLSDPVSIAVGKDEILYAADKGSCKIIKFTKNGDYIGAGDFGTAAIPLMIVSVKAGGGLMVTDSGEVFRFSEDGILDGKVRFPDGAGPVAWIISDGCGNLYASSPTGIYMLVSAEVFSTEPGFYYSRTLDSGTDGTVWHRLVMNADIPADTADDIYSYASDDEAIRKLIDQTIDDPTKTPQQKADIIDGVIPWSAAKNSGPDMLFQRNAGRFLWIKLELATYNNTVCPSVKEMRIFYPRISYLRYLPAIYQEDPASKDFLERFLSLFESIFYDLEIEIANITRYLDPDLAPPEFLKWLASWVDIAIEEDWQENTKRDFIRQAARLYTMKGTVEGISRFIQIYTGKIPVIFEHALSKTPAVLGGQFWLGINSTIVMTPVRGFRLGDDSILGRVAIRDTAYAPEDPFLSSAYRFTVSIDLTAEESERYEKSLRKIIAEGKPAHTAFSLIIQGGLSAGADSLVGISSIVGGYDRLQIGRSVVGGALLSSDCEDCGMIDEHVVIGKDTRLI